MMSIFAKEMMSKGRQEGLLAGLQEGRQEGLLAGLQEGRQEGHREEAAKILRRLLSRRFGELSAWVCDRVNSADVETLESWSDRVLDAHSLADVFGGNPVH